MGGGSAENAAPQTIQIASHGEHAQKKKQSLEQFNLFSQTSELQHKIRKNCCCFFNLFCTVA